MSQFDRQLLFVYFFGFSHLTRPLTRANKQLAARRIFRAIGLFSNNSAESVSKTVIEHRFYGCVSAPARFSLLLHDGMVRSIVQLLLFNLCFPLSIGIFCLKKKALHFPTKTGRVSARSTTTFRCQNTFSIRRWRGGIATIYAK